MADEVDEEEDEDEDEGGERGKERKIPAEQGRTGMSWKYRRRDRKRARGERFVRGREGSMPDFSSRATVEWMWV